MTKQDIATIERIVRGSCCFPEDAEFDTWLSVDQKQALDLLEHIHDRLPCGPLRDPFEGYHRCAETRCSIKIPPKYDHCWEHGGMR